MIDLSILVPGIRSENWVNLYSSTEKSCTKYSFEIIFVGPYELPEELLKKENIKYYQDFGSPIRCKQIALFHSIGQWITWASDDGLFLPNTLDDTLSLCTDINKVIYCKYSKDNTKLYYDDETCFILQNRNYTGISEFGKKYQLDNMSKLTFLYNPTFILDCAIINSIILKKIGGWDSSIFETQHIANADLSARLFKLGVGFGFQNNKVIHYSNIESNEDIPVKSAQYQNDEPKFVILYSLTKYIDRIYLDIENWERSPKIWDRRFLVQISRKH